MFAANTTQPTNQQLMLDAISEHVRAHIGEWLVEQNPARSNSVYEIELRERMIRLEEELKSQRELMKQGFDLMEKRFSAMSEENNRRFEAMSAENNKRFEALSKRIDRVLIWSVSVTMGTSSLVVAALKILL
uniref:DUF1640 domain-containing protein n=1 Tax=Candidatus Kentrum sp. FW TaxID=2126338 RepID=A0A450TR77_9GAMM|nr:MAG: hypothetical protein BECKFW1821B_GA0114236_11951 [Candidatus Kentron sp. FW]